MMNEKTRTLPIGTLIKGIGTTLKRAELAGWQTCFAAATRIEELERKLVLTEQALVSSGALFLCTGCGSILSGIGLDAKEMTCPHCEETLPEAAEPPKIVPLDEEHLHLLYEKSNAKD